MLFVGLLQAAAGIVITPSAPTTIFRSASVMVDCFNDILLLGFIRLADVLTDRGQRHRLGLFDDRPLPVERHAIPEGRITADGIRRSASLP